MNQNHIVTKRVVVRNDLGLHMRVAQQIVEVARRFKSTMTIKRDHSRANASSILELLMLAAVHGSILDLHASGEDAEAAIYEIAHLIDSKCDDDPRS